MKLSNSAIVGVGFVMMVAALLAMCIVSDINWSIVEQGRRGEMMAWPVVASFALALTGFCLCMHFGFKEFNSP